MKKAVINGLEVGLLFGALIALGLHMDALVSIEILLVIGLSSYRFLVLEVHDHEGD